MPSALVGKASIPLYHRSQWRIRGVRWRVHKHIYASHHYALSFNLIRLGALIFLMVCRNLNHGGRKSWLPTIEPSKTKSMLAKSNQGQTSSDRVPCLKTLPATHSRTWISG